MTFSEANDACLKHRLREGFAYRDLSRFDVVDVARLPDLQRGFIGILANSTTKVLHGAAAAPTKSSNLKVSHMIKSEIDSVNRHEKANSPIALWLAVLPILILIGLLVLNVRIYRDDASFGPNQIALLFAAAVAVVVGLFLKVPLSSMMDGVHQSIGSSLKAILILLMIGALVGTWVMSGIVPAMIYYGLQLLSPKIFLFAAVVICAIVSVGTGSSWSTVGTVGVALMGIGQALGVSPALAAGAVISGAYFGDKISPLSDTTNLAAAMAGTELFVHIRYMLLTTVPSILITLVIFLFIGFSNETVESSQQTNSLMIAINDTFHLSPWLFVVPGLVLLMVVCRVDAVAALFVGALLGGVAAMIWQPAVVTRIANLPPVIVAASESDEESAGAESTKEIEPKYWKRSYVAIVNALMDKTKVFSDEDVAAMEAELTEIKLSTASAVDNSEDESTAENQKVDPVLFDRTQLLAGKIAAAGLLEGKGMAGMLNTVWLVICAMTFGGVMEATGLLRRLTQSMLVFARSTGSLIATTVGSCLFVNVTASDQYLAIVVPGQMFRETYEQRGLAPENLSRTLEDSGTVTSVLVPWNTCGAFQSGTLNVETLLYAPFCFFNWISPLMTMLYGFTGLMIARREMNERSDYSKESRARNEPTPQSDLL